MKWKFYIRIALMGASLLMQTTIVQSQYNYYYATNNGTITITGAWPSGSGPMIIPGTINGLPVMRIAPFAFSSPSITSVIITNGLTSIGDWTFHHCAGLTNVVLGNSITNIGYYVFGCCSNLTQIMVSPANPVFSDVNGVLFDKSQTILIRYPAGLSGSYSVPAGVTSIAPSAFSRCSYLTSVAFPNDVINIESNAFDFCSGLTSIVIPDSVTNTGASAFARCTGLTNVTLGADLSTVGDFAFVFCTNLTTFAIPDSVFQVGHDAFDFYSGLSNLVLGVGVTRIGDSAFWSCTSLNGVLIPNSTTNIGNNSFWSCTSLTNITIGSGVAQIGTNAFYWCPSLIGINVDSLNPAYSSVGGALFNKSMTTLLQCPDGLPGNYSIPNGVTTIGISTFSDSSLSTITIPNTVTYIEPSAFDDCGNLMGFHFNGNAPGADITAFNYDTNTTVYYLPGTTGWGATFDGLPAVLWNLQVQTGTASFGLHANQFGFNITGTSNLVVVIEGCTNLLNPVWQPIRTNTLTGGVILF